jgi:hypothetical protein
MSGRRRGKKTFIWSSGCGGVAKKHLFGHPWAAEDHFNGFPPFSVWTAATCRRFESADMSAHSKT